MKKIKQYGSDLITLLMETAFFMLSFLQPVFAQQSDIGRGADTAAPTGASSDLGEIFRKVANILLFLVGAVSVIMLIIGGFRYVVSGGDSAGVEGAKNTILYAIVGIVVAFLSYAAVNFVIGRLEG